METMTTPEGFESWTADAQLAYKLGRSEQKAYNGWKNYPTWAVNLWLSNDEGLAADVQNLIVEIGADDEDNTRRVDVADAIKDFVNEITPDLGATFAADLLGYALGEVDWEEIATAWLEED